MADSRKKSPAVRAESVRAGYEVTDASARGIFLTGIVALAVGLLIHFALWWLLFDFKHHVHDGYVPRSALVQTDQTPPAGAPRLQLNPQLETRELERRSEEQLKGAGWIDQKGGWARIPIDAAMELLIQKQGGKERGR